MTEVTETNGNGSIKFNVPILGNIVAKGPAVFIVLAIMAGGFAILEREKDLIKIIETENAAREAEHETLRKWIEYSTCTNRLNLYIFQHPRGEPIDWVNMPEDLYKCAIQNFADMKRQNPPK